MPQEQDPNREELIESGNSIRRQIEILQRPVNNSKVQTREMAARLMELLKEIAKLIQERDASEKERRGS